MDTLRAATVQRRRPTDVLTFWRSTSYWRWVFSRLMDTVSATFTSAVISFIAGDQRGTHGQTGNRHSLRQTRRDTDTVGDTAGHRQPWLQTGGAQTETLVTQTCRKVRTWVLVRPLTCQRGRVSEGADLGVGQTSQERDDVVHQVLVVDDAVLALLHQRRHKVAEVGAELLPLLAGLDQRVFARLLGIRHTDGQCRTWGRSEGREGFRKRK